MSCPRWRVGFCPRHAARLGRFWGCGAFIAFALGAWPGVSMPPDAAVPSATGRPFLWGGVLLLLVLAAYSPVVRAEFIWDDDDYLLNNPTLRSPGGLERIWLEP